jgi:MFS family permease
MVSAAPAHPARAVALVCLAEALSMTGFGAYPAFLPQLQAYWALSGAEAGFVSGAFFLGYMVAVPFLSGATDRIDARAVFAFSCLLAAVGTAGFALFAQGTVSGAIWQSLAGAGLAGTYMPGLKALTDRISGPRLPRYVAFYTSTFGIGTSASLLAAGWLDAVLSWRAAFGLLAVGPLLAAPLLLAVLAPRRPHGADAARWLPRIGPVLAQHDIRRAVFGYAAHCWELFGLRSWMVAFVAFAYGSSGAVSPLLSATAAAALINLLGIPASVLGNEAASRVGRARWIGAVMVASGTFAWLAGLSANWPWPLMLGVLAMHFVAVMADSAALTAGLVEVTPPEQRGAALAVYSLMGFGAGFVAPLAVGAVLDAAGGANSRLAWTLAFGALGVGGLVWAATNGQSRR